MKKTNLKLLRERRENLILRIYFSGRRNLAPHSKEEADYNFIRSCKTLFKSILIQGLSID